MIRIDSAFDPITLSIHNFFQQPGVGYYIPLYQREYTWDQDNIDQLVVDLSRGIENSLSDDDEIRFLGTIILVQESNPTENIEPQDPRGLPSRIDKVIDGQQRLSTLALMAAMLYDRISIIEDKIADNEPLRDEIIQTTKDWKKKLVDIFSLDLGRGTPERKPIIIRGNIDQWTMNGEIERNYKSPVSNYLAQYISYVLDPKGETDKPKFNKQNRVGKNLRLIQNWLSKTIEIAHVIDGSDFLPAWDIINEIDQKYIWQYERDNLVAEINKREVENKKSISYLLCSVVQLFSICHYLLDRCCFTVIKPTKDDWAFDLFQSLNATGTPLTAIETFAPLVVNTTNQCEGSYYSSRTKENFENVEKLFDSTNTAAQKNKLTNDFLTSLALTTDGSQLSSHFSNQRKWLHEIYTGLEPYELKKGLISFFGNYATYYKEVWIEYSGENSQVLSRISSHEDADLCSLMLLFLKQANHKMSIAVLGRFYNDVLNNEEESVPNFIEACKLTFSFYVLWRSVKSNSGLDKAYRDFYQKKKDYEGYSWKESTSISLDDLRSHYINCLSEIGVDGFKTWSEKALRYLKYNNSKTVCRMALLMAFHQTISDEENPGLMKIGAEGVAPYLKLERWNSDDLKTIEHIAPQVNNGSWDDKLYTIESELYQSIGNLTLLPTDINSSIGNKSWTEKLIYYKHIREEDPTKKQKLRKKAQDAGIELKEETIKILEKVRYSKHMDAIVKEGDKINWNADLVEKRAKKILELVWGKTASWINFK
ncbi:DUF262 domain-containing HNH endonuclease family protein [Robiginitalea biformata]|uniref:DUF262 domain-containing protein n=1 Tax=Robiginitalea biformata (strain ATCC BAA-864 / DSM 15991 / KCTC 12146 / HTCC2501) TaxID=313596 RepID=A4CHS3_ROBBH|nr:DUF262 domain-containing HNH endonuclease family protein [Robiginitalea biformata]EAR16481.1 hypothetical protein RB2501_06265 [Robiginitalea biformata HTCC2501]